MNQWYDNLIQRMRHYCMHSAQSAIGQIRDRRYPASLERYAGRILLAGISYDRDDPEKRHTYVIEEWEKSA